MKTIRTLLIALAALTACTADEATNPTVGNPADAVGITTTVTTTVIADTRADATGVAAYTPTTGTKLTLFYGDMNAAATATYTYTDGTPGTEGAWATDNPLYWNNLNAINAEYPFFAAAPAVPPATPVVRTDQNIEANYTASDLLIAYTATTQRRTDVALTMRHVLSQITVSIASGTTDGNPIFTPEEIGAAALTIAGAKTAYRLAYNKDADNPAVATATGDVPAGHIIPLKTATAQPNPAVPESTTFAAIVPTQTFAIGALTLNFTIKGKPYTWTNKDAITLATGTRTHISLTAAISSVELKEVSVAPWTDAANPIEGSIDTDDVLTAGRIEGITEAGLLSVNVYKADGTSTQNYGSYPIIYNTGTSTATFDKGTGYSPIKWANLTDKTASYTYTAFFVPTAVSVNNHEPDYLGGVSVDPATIGTNAVNAVAPAFLSVWGTRPSFALSHLMSRLVVKLSCTDDTYDAAAINAATITVQSNQTFNGATFSSTGVTMNYSPDEAPVTLIKEADATDVTGTPASFYAILCPQELMATNSPDDDLLTLTITPTGNPVGSEKTYTMKTPVTLVAGKTFTLNATLSASSLEPGSITVNGWDTTTSGDGSLEIK